MMAERTKVQLTNAVEMVATPVGHERSTLRHIVSVDGEAENPFGEPSLEVFWGAPGNIGHGRSVGVCGREVAFYPLRPATQLALPTIRPMKVGLLQQRLIGGRAAFDRTIRC